MKNKYEIRGNIAVKYRGVTYNKNNGKYDLRITIKGNTKWWRNFNTAEEANFFGIQKRMELMPYSNEDVV